MYPWFGQISGSFWHDSIIIWLIQLSLSSPKGINLCSEFELALKKPQCPTYSRPALFSFLLLWILFLWHVNFFLSFFNCLERLDQDTSGILTTLCDHSFQCSCISKWTDSSCPVSMSISLLEFFVYVFLMHILHLLICSLRSENIYKFLCLFVFYVVSIYIIFFVHFFCKCIHTYKHTFMYSNENLYMDYHAHLLVGPPVYHQANPFALTTRHELPLALLWHSYDQHSLLVPLLTTSIKEVFRPSWCKTCLSLG